MPPDWTVFEPPGPLAHCAGRVTPKGPVILPASICLSAIAPGPHPTRAALKINGIRLYLLERGRVSNRYVVPELGVTLDVQRGDAARPVLDTLTSSARRVALAPGRAPTVPDTWRTVTYAGITLRVPPTMRVFQLDSHTILGACGTQMFSSAAVFLGDGSRGIPTCLPMVSRGLPTPTDGVWIEFSPERVHRRSGRHRVSSSTWSTCPGCGSGSTTRPPTGRCASNRRVPTAAGSRSSISASGRIPRSPARSSTRSGQLIDLGDTGVAEVDQFAESPGQWPMRRSAMVRPDGAWPVRAARSSTLSDACCR